MCQREGNLFLCWDFSCFSNQSNHTYQKQILHKQNTLTVKDLRLEPLLAWNGVFSIIDFRQLKHREAVQSRWSSVNALLCKRAGMTCSTVIKQCNIFDFQSRLWNYVSCNLLPHSCSVEDTLGHTGNAAHYFSAGLWSNPLTFKISTMQTYQCIICTAYVLSFCCLLSM